MDSNKGINKKNINSILNKKFDEWVESIDDEHIRHLVEHNTIISGGCIASMLLGENCNDYDVYFQNFETAYQVAKYYIDRYEEIYKEDINEVEFLDLEVITDEDNDEMKRIKIKNSSGREIYARRESRKDKEEIKEEDKKSSTKKSDKKYEPKFITDNAITLTDQIQIVIRFYGEVEEVLGNFDFVHCMNYWTSHDRQLVLRQDALESLLCKELKYVGSKYPFCSIVRTRKFISKGWIINAGQYLKMAIQLCELDFKDPNILQDQLIGVDTEYFRDFINKLEESNDEKLDKTALYSIIDEIFG
ncbi:MAG: hypothetical protein ACOCQD_03485 [archaeon]